MVEPLRHRQTKEAATDMLDLKSPRHTSTLPKMRKSHSEHFSTAVPQKDGVIGRQLVDS